MNAAPAKSATRNSCRLTIVINGTSYQVVPVRNKVGTLYGFNLRKQGGGAYQVDVAGGCSCPSFRFDHEPEGTECKHLKACRAAGLLQD